MSKLLEMSEDFEKTSKQQAADIEQTVKAAFNAHVNSIRGALKESEQKIKSDIAGHRKVTRLLILEDWTRALLIIFLVLGGLYGSVWVQGKIIADNQKTISEQKQTIERLAEQTWGIKLHAGAKGRFIVLPADQEIETNWTMRKRPAIRLVEEG